LVGKYKLEIYSFGSNIILILSLAQPMITGSVLKTFRQQLQVDLVSLTFLELKILQDAANLKLQKAARFDHHTDKN